MAGRRETLMPMLSNTGIQDATMTLAANHNAKGIPLSGRALLIGLLCATTGPALSQGQPTPSQQATRAATRVDDVIVRPHDTDEKVHLALGLVGNVSPQYSGSDKIGTALAPAGRISWRGYSISRSSVVRARSTGCSLAKPASR